MPPRGVGPLRARRLSLERALASHRRSDRRARASRALQKLLVGAGVGDEQPLRRARRRSLSGPPRRRFVIPSESHFPPFSNERRTFRFRTRASPGRIPCWQRPSEYRVSHVPSFHEGGDVVMQLCLAPPRGYVVLFPRSAAACSFASPFLCFLPRCGCSSLLSAASATAHRVWASVTSLPAFPEWNRMTTAICTTPRIITKIL